MDLKISVLLIMAVAIIYIGMINFFTILFRITGLTKEKARFQVISMLTNSGFTTGESELITTNKVRRRLCLACMITGNIFSVVIVSLFVNALFNLSHQQAEGAYQMIFYAFLIFVAVLIIFKIPFVKNPLEKLIEKCGTRLLTKNNKDNVLTVLDNYGKMAIVEIYINTTPKAFENKSLFESGLKEKYNLNLMMLKRKNSFIEVTRNTVIQKKDIIVVFGLQQTINDLFKLTNKDFSLIVEEKTKENIVTLIDNYGDNAMAEIVVNSIPEMLDGATLEDSKIKLLHDINILTIKRNENVVEITRDTIIEVNDIITVFGSYKSIKKLFLNIE